MIKFSEWADTLLARLLVPSVKVKVRFTGDMKRIQMRPDDVLVLSSEESIPDETCMRLRAAVEEKFPGHRCIVLTEGLKLGLIGVPTLRDEFTGSEIHVSVNPTPGMSRETAAQVGAGIQRAMHRNG